MDQNGQAATSPDIDSALARAKQGNPAGFDQLYAALSPAVMAVAMAERSPDPKAATNAIMANVFDDLNRFVGDARDLALFTYRSAWFFLAGQARSRDQSTTEASSRPAPANQVGTEHGLNTESLEFLIGEATSLMTASQREVIALRIYFDLSADDTARVLQLPLEEVAAIQDSVKARFDSLAER